MFRASALLLIVGVAAVGSVPVQQPAKDGPMSPPKSGAAKGEKNSWLTPSLLASGYELLKGKAGVPNLTISPTFDFRPHFSFNPRVSLFAVNVEKFEVNLGGANKERMELLEQIGRETNDLLKQQLEIQKRQLDVQIKQLEIATEQARQYAKLSDQMAEAFKYQQDKDAALLRKLQYEFPVRKLVVVVADFSSGDGKEGVEIADEIGNALHELRRDYGVDVEILVGETLPTRVIRSEQMARDLGRHFPVGTAYAVIWGTLSPRTTGKFRPHVTCVIKVDDEKGQSRSYTIDPQSQDLPAGDEVLVRRRQYEQLVGFACAVVPGCYAAHELSNDRKPDLGRYYELLNGDPVTRPIADRYQAELGLYMHWLNVQAQGDYQHLRRLTAVDPAVRYPRCVLNTRDRSQMVLITEPDSDTPKTFEDKDGKYIAYIDMTETTVRQIVPFIEEKGNPAGEGADRFKFDNVPFSFDEAAKKVKVDDPKAHSEVPVCYVSYWGAQAYCRWAGKQLTRTEEWQAAARPAGKGKHPWGDADWRQRCANKSNSDGRYGFHRVGAFAGGDRSGTGCLDMAGNVSEWCDDYPPRSDANRTVCGGNFGDDQAARFETTAKTEVAAVTHHGWIGFRGVVRVRLPK